MKWTKLGKIFEVNSNNNWMESHSALPFANHLRDDIFRIYFSVRNKFNQSQSSYFDFDLSEMKVVNELKAAPLMIPGPEGNFDDAGVTLSCYCVDNDLFYYMGWHLPKNVPFDNQIGAASLNGNLLIKHDNNPILGKCEKEPFSFGYPWVLKVKDTYFIWYDTNLFWNMEKPKDYEFQLRSAVSKDGVKWEKTYQNNIVLKDYERAIARPCVIYEDDIFKMWYSVDVNGKYSLGYAESNDGLNWNRMDERVGIFKSEGGWDSEEIEYPFVFNHKNKKFMLYNGNGYGKTGIGLAILDK